MATAVTMPRLGLTMVEGTVVDWRAGVGDAVEKGAVLLVVESEKAEVEIEAFASGILAAIYVDVGTTAPVGALLGAIAAPGEPFDLGAFAARFVPAETQSSAAPPARAREEAPPASREPAGLKAAPAARALARGTGVDLAVLRGTGPGGRITVADVERAAAPVVHVNGTGLSVSSAGRGSGVLLIPGWGVDASGWRRQVDVLAARHTVVTYDHRGIGDSWRIDEPALTLGQLAADAHALLVARDLAPAVVVGASMGAAVALELALAHGESLRALVLIAPIVGRDARFEAVLRGWCAHEAPTSDARIRAMLPWLLGRPLLAHAGKRAAAAAAWRQMATRTPAASLRQHAEALLAWLGTRGADLGRIAVPALVIVGADDVLTPPAEAEEVARRLPRARLECVDGAGHAVMMERADEVNALVRDWIAEH